MLADVSAERLVLGCIFAGPSDEDLAQCVALLRPEDFSQSVHSRAWRAVCELHSSGQLVSDDMVTRKSGLSFLELDDIRMCASTPAMLMHWSRELRKMGHAREVAQCLQSAAQSIIDTQGSDDGINAALADVAGLEAMSDDGQRSMSNVLQDFFGEIERRGTGKGRFLPTGYRDIDSRLSGGLSPADLVILAARPSMGKTALALNMARRMACDSLSVFIATVEMSEDAIIERMASEHSEVPSADLKTGKLSEAHWKKLTESMNDLRMSRMGIEYMASPTVGAIRASALRHKAKCGLDVIVVDYIQLMTGKGGNRNEEVGSISRGLKTLAGELDCTVIALSQLNRALESRTNRRPMMSDLRDSGAIEQDADIIWFLYRDEVYNPDTDQKGVCEVNTAKYRNGAVGLDFLKWEKDYTRFI